MSGVLYLLPNLLEPSLPIEDFFPKSVNAAIESIQGLIVESEKTGRRYLRKFLTHDEMARCPLALLNEHEKDLEALIAPMQRGEKWGLISDAGLPCLADPGAELVWLAHQRKVRVETFVGPSSLIMALQLSGFSAQNFAFHGYLPREEGALVSKLEQLEKSKGTHIWIEAPYRSEKMYKTLLKHLQLETRLCIAVNLTTPEQKVVSFSIKEWKKIPFSIGKEPAVFLIFAK